MALILSVPSLISLLLKRLPSSDLPIFLFPLFLFSACKCFPMFHFVLYLLHPCSVTVFPELDSGLQFLFLFLFWFFPSFSLFLAQCLIWPQFQIILKFRLRLLFCLNLDGVKCHLPSYKKLKKYKDTKNKAVRILYKGNKTS